MIDGGVAGKVVAPHRLPGEARLILIAEQNTAHLRIHAVSTDHQAVTAIRAVSEKDIHTFGVLFERLHTQPEAHLSTQLYGSSAQHLVQSQPRNTDVGRVLGP